LVALKKLSFGFFGHHSLEQHVQMRDYCKRAPTDEEMKRYANGVLSGQCKLYSHHILLGSFSRSAVCRTDNLQQVEDEIKLLGMVRRSGGGGRPAGHAEQEQTQLLYLLEEFYTIKRKKILAPVKTIKAKQRKKSYELHRFLMTSQDGKVVVPLRLGTTILGRATLQLQEDKRHARFVCLSCWIEIFRCPEVARSISSSFHRSTQLRSTSPNLRAV